MRSNRMGMVKRNAGICLFICLAGAMFSTAVLAQEARVYESEKQIQTYPFNDPDPVPILKSNNTIYPYFRFDGYSTQAETKSWKVVYLENPYIKVAILPEVGGKVYGAIEKSTGYDFIYQNSVLKFRDIGLRGPWTSGGIEFNFGVQGHAPTTATPVDYLLKENEDGSVSCFIGALDLASRTQWSVEIRLPKDAASFQTKSFWYNPTPLNQSYYYWSNAAIHTGNDLEYFFPGTNYIGHGGDLHSWPVRDNNKISVYKNNNFGGNKSYHVLGKYENFSGAYWHDLDIGYGHWGRYSEIPGKKIWIWSLARSGGIWEDLLTDSDGQYSEVQGGRLFSQAALSSGLSSPFNQYLFSPQSTDQWQEHWFPVKGIGGIDEATSSAAINLEQSSSQLAVNISAIETISDTLKVLTDGILIHSEAVSLQPTEVLKTEVTIESRQKSHTVQLGKHLAVSTQSNGKKELQRPLSNKQEANSSPGKDLNKRAEEQFAYRHYDEALELYLESLNNNPVNKQALARLAEIYTRRGQYKEALTYAERLLAYDTYDAEGNFIYGIINRRMNRRVQAKEAFGWAARSLKYRSVGWQQMAEIYMAENNWEEAIYYAQKALDFNAYNMNAKKVLATAFRKSNRVEKAQKAANDMLQINPLSHYANFEKFLMDPSEQNKNAFTSIIRNELPHETYLELAMDYYSMGQVQEAKEALTFASSSPIANYWLAYLNREESGEWQPYLKKAQASSPHLVYPFRHETIPVLEWALKQNDDWKTGYYLALIMWSKGRNDEAVELMQSLGNQPDFAPFYLSRSYLLESHSPEDAESDIQKALTLSPGKWRPYHRLAGWYTANEQYARAEDIAEKGSRKFPDNYYLGLQYANILSHNEDYEASLQVLKNLEVLPSEGARYAHNIFANAHIQLAMRYMNQKKYDEAMDHIEGSRTWPEHLGVGKPFKPDERVQNYLEAYIHRTQDNTERADSLYNDILEYSNTQVQDIQSFNFPNFISLLVYGHYDQEDKVKDIKENFIQDLNDRKLLQQWIKLRGDQPTDAQRDVEKALLANMDLTAPDWLRAFIKFK